MSDAPSAVLPVRRVRFHYPDDIDPAWVPGLPEFAYAANGLSLLMPYAEPLFIKAVRSAFPVIDDDLRARTEPYIKQEVGHYREHERFNEIIRRHHPGRAMRRSCRTAVHHSQGRSNTPHIADIHARPSSVGPLNDWRVGSVVTTSRGNATVRIHRRAR